MTYKKRNIIRLLTDHNGQAYNLYLRENLANHFENDTDFDKALQVLTFKNWIYETDLGSKLYQINEQMTKTEDLVVELDDYKVLSNGSDGGHIYLKTKTVYNGQERDLIIFFLEKSEEKKVKETEKLIIDGDLMDDGNEFSLTLFNSTIKKLCAIIVLKQSTIHFHQKRNG
ncbi:MAG: hypothetical protein IPH96_00405 [Saprospiraceae bacterium]|nr:hypothetical protein [Saprospiraceae bacterium]